MRYISFSVLVFGLAFLLNLQLAQAQKETDTGQFPKGSLISNIGTFPMVKYELTSKENIHYFSGVFNGLPTFNFGVDESEENQASPIMLDRLMKDAVIFNTVGNVKFSNENGTVSKGDALTISSIPGMVAKASSSDKYILGIALESSDGKDNGLISSRIIFQLRE